MKKLILFIPALLLFLSSTLAQTTITNGGFETWDNVGQSTAEPSGWNSNKTGGGNATTGPQTCYQETSNPHGGTYCAKVLSGNVIGIVVNGSLTTGKVEAPDLNKAHGYIHDIVTDANYHMNFTGRPDSLVFWYRYTKQGSDYPTVEARLHVGNAYAPETPSGSNHPDSTVNIIARATWQGPASTQATWTRISLPFTYVDSRTPAYILITSTSSGDQTGGTSGSTLWLDDFAAIYNPAIAVGTVTTGPYYVSAAAGTTISVPYTLTGTFNGGNTVTAQLSDASGSFAAPVTIGSVTSTSSGTITATIPAGTASGTGYRVRVVASNPALTSSANTANITVVLVNTSVTPAGAQTILTNTDGNQLTVTETATPTSREWKYSTTSGSGYQSFSIAQTATTYTPNFATAGHYYVVCVTTYPGSLTTTSNEVAITAVENSIAPSSTQTILVNADGMQLTATESPAATSREWKYSTTNGGPYASFGTAQTAATYTPNFATAGVYYVVCVSNFGGFSVTSNQVQINVVTNTIAPATTQNIIANANGNVLTVTETPAAVSRQWKYSTTSGSGYQAFSVAQTATTYTPNFATAGTYYVVCVSTFSGNVNVTSNEVQINVLSNSIAPSGAQSILVGVNGTMLTVTELPSGTSREWKYSTTSGSGYVSFGTAQTGTTYTPNFNSAGSYYVVCVSVINGVSVTSNEVLISVGNATITTGTVTGSPYLFSPSAPAASVNVPFTLNGTFNPGNIFTAQLSDASGSFATPVSIGTLTSTTAGTVNASIPSNTAAGTGYRIRVVSSNPPVNGSDNGTDLVIDQFHNSIAPTATQSIALATNGTPLTVTESQTATHLWKYSTTSGSGYASFGTPQTGSSYTPNFATPGTYYVVCVSTNGYTDAVTSNEVQIDVANGSTITTLTVNGSPFYVSPNANVPVSVDFTSNAVFNGGNIFAAQLSDATGSFANPVTIGTLNGSTIATISAQIPNNSITGTHYRIRMVSSNPAITGSDNGVDLTIDQFANSVAPPNAQNITYNTNGVALAVFAAQAVAQQWRYTTTSGSGYLNFTPAETGSSYTPNFAAPGTYYVVAVSYNQYGDSVISNEVQIDVLNGTTITTGAVNGSPYYTSDSAHITVDVTFTSNAIFDGGNVFTAQLSDANGSFAAPVNIGTLSGSAIGNIHANIPNSAPAGTAYRIRVVSSSPAINGSDNGNDLEIIPFHVSAVPSDTQNLFVGQAGSTIRISSTHPNCNFHWQFSNEPGFNYGDFNPPYYGDTLLPAFSSPNAYYLICTVRNQQHASITIQEIVVLVTVDTTVGIKSTNEDFIKAYWNDNSLMVDLRASLLVNPVLELINTSGQIVVGEKLQALSLNNIVTQLPKGLYILNITDGGRNFTAKTIKR